MVNGLQWSPGRFWRNKTGVPNLSRIIRTINTKKGDSKISAGIDMLKSQKRLLAYDDCPFILSCFNLDLILCYITNVAISQIDVISTGWTAGTSTETVCTI